MPDNVHISKSIYEDSCLHCGTSEDSTLTVPHYVWHHPSCTCRYKTNCPLQLPQPAYLHEERLPQHKSFATSTIVSVCEKMASSLPRKKYGRLMRNARWTWFSVYRRLYLIVLLPNILTMIILGAQRKLLILPSSAMALAVAFNITAAVLIRQELVINLLFAFFGMCPHWVPLRLRRLIAKIYHLGGVHSGAGISATIWYTILNGVILKDYLEHRIGEPRGELPITVVTFIINVLFLSIIILSHPILRAKFHNSFEAVHRFAGWAAVALFWVQLFLLADVQSKAVPPTPLGTVICQSPVLYLLFIVTISLILPWLRLRKVPVVVEPLSSHAVRLHFEYTNVPLCAAPRISDSPLKEWHAFAAIPEDDGRGFSIIVSKAGDWTSKLIESPPTSMWVRGIPARGVLHIAPIFKSMVLVATGSGIGPILSLLTARGILCRILWSTKDPLRTYGQRIIDDILLADPQAVIIDTKNGLTRPNLVEQAHKLYKQSGAEAIFVISNPAATRKVVFGLESRGLPTFAPIFDS